jgi:Lrp/AsnC family leucine-responsive transcriptional regulator
MDKVDWAILEHLERDGRESFGAIAERVSLSKTPCWTRVQSLERNGVIRGYRAVIDPYAVGLKLTAFIEVTIEFGNRVAFERAVAEHPAIIECYTTAGEADYLLQVMTSDVERLDSLLREELCRLPGVQRSATTICLKRIKNNGPITRASGMLHADG